MVEEAAPYDSGQIACAACGAPFTPKHARHRCCSGACRAKRSRQRAAEGPGPGKIAACRIIKGGFVSVTIHLPPGHLDRIADLRTGRWANVTPWSTNG